MALTDGVVNQDIPHLASLHRSRPAFPFDQEFDFMPKANLSARWSESV
jgi:hypothetical protein